MQHAELVGTESLDEVGQVLPAVLLEEAVNMVVVLVQVASPVQEQAQEQVEP